MPKVSIEIPTPTDKLSGTDVSRGKLLSPDPDFCD